MEQNSSKFNTGGFIKNIDMKNSNINAWPNIVPTINPSMPYIYSNDNLNNIQQNRTFSNPNFQNYGSTEMICLSQSDNMASPSYLNGYASNVDLTSGLNSPSSFSDNFNLLFPNSNNQNYDSGSINEASLGVSNFIINQPIQNTLPLMIPQQNIVNSSTPDVKITELNPNQVSLMLPTLITMLSSPKQDEVIKAAYTLYHLVKSDKTRAAVYGDNNIIPVIVNTMRQNFTNGSILRSCSAFAYYISLNNKDALKILYKSDIFIILDQLLELGMDGVLYYTISTVHSIFLNVTESRDYLSNNNHLTKFLKLFSHKNDKFLAIISDCICICIKNVDKNFIIQSTDAVKYMVEVLETRSYEKLIFNTCRLLKEVSSSDNSKRIIIKMGAITHLTKLLLNISRRVAVNALLTIRNLSDMANSEKDMTDLMNILVRFIINQISVVIERKPTTVSSTKLEEQLVICSLGILANLTCNNPENKIFLIKKNIISILLNICQVIKTKEIIESAISTLRNLTCRNSESLKACDQFLKLDGFKIIMNIVLTYMNVPLPNSSYLKKVIFGLLLNFASQKEYINILRDYKITQLTAHTLAAVMEETKENSVKSSTNVRGVNLKIHLHNLNKLLETCVIILHLMTTDEISIQLMISSSVLISLCTKLLLFNSSNLVSYVIGFLFDISKTQNGLTAIANGFLLTHKNEISGLNSSSGNICVDRLKDILVKSQQNAPIVQTINCFLMRLNSTSLSKYIRVSIPCYDDLSTDVDLNFQSLLNNDLNGVLDSPTLAISPYSSKIFDRF